MSDIHFGQEDKNGQLHVHNDVRLELERDCERLGKRDGLAHGVIVTGDIAYSGKIHEYEKAVEWLDSLCDKVGCERDSVLVVPGNHDVDLEKLKGASRFTQERLKSCNEHELENLLREVHQSPDEAHPFAPKSAAYRRLADVYKCDFKITDPYWHKYFDLSHGCKLKFFGLNTVQVTDLKDKPGDLILGESQFVQSREDNVEFVFLMHHPVHWLKDRSKFEDYFNSRVRIIICGHEHKPKVTSMNHGMKFEQLVIDSGATNPPIFEQGYGFTYNWLEFDLAVCDKGKSKLIVRIFPRIWNKADTRFEADSRRVKLSHCNGEAAEILLACPDLSPMVSSTSNPGETTDAADKEEVNDINLGGEALVSGGEDRRFKRLQYFFWRYTKAGDRLSILVDLSLIQNSTALDALPQDLEMHLLQRAKEQGKLRRLWDEVMKLVPDDQRQENAFKEGE